MLKPSKEKDNKQVGGNDTVFNPDPEKYKIASAMVYGSILKRRNEQSVNWYMLALGVFVLVFLPIWWVSSIIKKSELAKVERVTRRTEIANIILGGTPTPVIVNDPMMTQFFTAYPSPVTSTPTPSPLATWTTLTTSTPAAWVSPTPEFLAFGYSFYYPDLGGVNCHVDNWVDGHCKDTTASGASWRDYIGRGVAIPPSFLERFPYGTIFRVVSPSVISGDYTVIDLCPACEQVSKPGSFWIDFLDTGQRLDWSQTVIIQVVH